MIHANETKDENTDPVPSTTDRKTTSHGHRPTKAATVTSWGFDWLCFETENGYVTKVWCKICRERYQDRCPESSTSTPSALHPGQVQVCDLDAYITGTTNVKKDTAKSHLTSKSHIATLHAMAPLQETEIAKQFRKMDETMKARLCKLFDLAYTVAKCEQPFSLFETLISVEKKHGVQLGQAYANNKACREFISHIAGAMIDELEELLKPSQPEVPFYCSLLFDGSTDKAISEKEVISIKLIEDGVPKIKLLG